MVNEELKKELIDAIMELTEAECTEILKKLEVNSICKAKANLTQSTTK